MYEGDSFFILSADGQAGLAGFSALFLPLKESFGLSAAMATTVISLRHAMAIVASPLGGFVFDRHGPRIALAWRSNGLREDARPAQRGKEPHSFLKTLFGDRIDDPPLGKNGEGLSLPEKVQRHPEGRVARFFPVHGKPAEGGVQRPPYRVLEEFAFRDLKDGAGDEGAEDDGIEVAPVGRGDDERPLERNVFEPPDVAFAEGRAEVAPHKRLEPGRLAVLR